jgi:hypothetical protein
MSCFLSSIYRVLSPIARMPWYVPPLGNGRCERMSPCTLDSWDKLILDCLGVQGISLSLLSPEHALKPKLEIVAALSVKPCGPTSSQLPQTCLAIVFSSNRTTSWQASNEHGIGGEAWFLMIVSLLPQNSQLVQAGRVYSLPLVQGLHQRGTVW